MNQTPSEIKHGVDGWQLERYSWDKRSGTTRLTYERDGGKECGGQTTVVMTRHMTWAQPDTGPGDVVGR